MTVADIGAGSGYYVVRLAPIVGPNGRIIAQDVMPEYLRSLGNRVRDLGLQNVTISLGEPHDPRLPTHSLDAAILVHMCHEIAQFYGLLYNRAGVEPGARVGIVDAMRRPPGARHPAQSSALRARRRRVPRDRLLPAHGQRRYLAIFAPPSDESRTQPGAMNAVYAVAKLDFFRFYGRRPVLRSSSTCKGYFNLPIEHHFRR